MGLIISPATVTIDDAAALGEALHKLVPNIVEWGGDPDGSGRFESGIYVAVQKDPKAAERAAIESFAETNRVAIEVEVNPNLAGVVELDSRDVDPNPYSSGDLLLRVRRSD